MFLYLIYIYRINKSSSFNMRVLLLQTATSCLAHQFSQSIMTISGWCDTTLLNWKHRFVVHKHWQIQCPILLQWSVVCQEWFGIVTADSDDKWYKCTKDSGWVNRPRQNIWFWYVTLQSYTVTLQSKQSRDQRITHHYNNTFFLSSHIQTTLAFPSWGVFRMHMFSLGCKWKY